MVQYYPPSLQTICRFYFTVFGLKWALAYFYPALAQETTDFCKGCTLSSEAGHVTGEFEAFTYLFIGLIFLAAQNFEEASSMRTVLNYFRAFPVLKLLSLAKLHHYGGPGELDSQYVEPLLENLVLLIVALLTCFVWYPKTGAAGGASRRKFDLYDYKTGIQSNMLEALILAVFALYNILTGDSDKLRPNDAGSYGSHMVSATQFGIAILLYGISNLDDADKLLVVKYMMVKKFIELFYLSVLAAPFAIASDGESGLNTGLNGAYATTLFFSITLVHLNCCWMYGPPRRAVFWFGSLLGLFLGALGLFYPNSTAMAFYRVPQLEGVSSEVFRLVGMGSFMFGTAMFAFSTEMNEQSFENMFVYAYSIIIFHGLYIHSVPEFGVFSDLLNIFYVWCVWQNWSKRPIAIIKPWIPSFLRRGMRQVAEVTSPKSSPRVSSMVMASKMKSSRNKTPRKST